MIKDILWRLTPHDLGNEENSSLAILLNTALLTLIAVSSLVVATIAIYNNKIEVLAPVFAIEFAVAVAFLYLIKMGYASLTRILFVSTLWLIPTIISIYSGGVNPVTLASFTTIVLIAGLLISVRSSVVFAVMSGAAVVAITYVENQAGLPQPIFNDSLLYNALGLFANFTLVIAMIHISKTVLRSNSDDAGSDSIVLLESSHEFKTSQLQLIDQAIELTRANTELKKEIAARTKVEGENKRALAEKEVLLKEIHHRVKNNLQIVSSLLYLQSKKVKSQESKEVFLESQNRIRAMSLIHEKLYQSEDLADIDLDDYLHSLVKSLFTAYGVNTSDVQYTISAKNTALDVELAIPCGVIISELVSNSLKHGFPEGVSGNIWVEVEKKPPADWSIRVRDDGVGISSDKDSESEPSLGLQLVENLAAQLNGDVTVHRNGSTDIEINFSGEEPQNKEQ